MDQRKNIAWALVTCTALLVLLMAMLPTASGQSMTGQISGSVVDPQSAVIPGATVTLTNALTGQTREVESGAQGAFVFTQLLAGTYDVSVSASGFKVYEQKGIKLSANEKVALSGVQLQIGTTAETVEVTADVARVETQSSERTGLISTTQVQELAASPNRNFITLLKVIPGVYVPSDQGVTNVGGPPGMQYQVLGGRSGQTVVTLDGVVDADTTMNASTSGYVNPNVDAISEMKVMLTNYTAEYGIRSGGTINVSIKNGTREFHGSGYYFKRHEKLNANEWNNNRNNIPKQRYRYDNFGGTIGGPIIIPGTSFNKSREKLFFFLSLEWLRNVSPSGVVRQRFPTDLERKGDFSQTVDRAGGLLIAMDPLTGQPFPGNVIPPERGDAVGKGFLNFYPMPNRTDWSDGDNSYNWIGNYLTESPRNEQIFRIDWNVAPKTLIYARYARTASPVEAPVPRELIEVQWPVLGALQNLHSLGFVTTWIQTISPSVVNEATVGFNKGYQDSTPWEDQLPDVQRQNIPGVADFQQFHPEINQDNIMPSALFAAPMGGPGGPPPGPGGGSNSLIPSIQVASRFNFNGDNTLWNITDNLSWVIGKNSLKFGFYAELTSRNAVRHSNRSGSFDFQSDRYNIYDTGLPMANAFIGTVKQYQESDKSQLSHARYHDIEFYAQDSWRATRRLTIDIGARFQYIAPTWFKDGQMGIFEISSYDPGTAMKYITETTGGMGKNPYTGEIVGRTYIGSFAMPAGVTYTPEEMYPAVGVFDKTYLNNPGFQISPRFGFAYDVFGDGKMAIRGGFGMFFERSGGDEFQADYLQVPPVQNLATIYYTTVPQLKTATFTYGPASGFYAVNASQRDFSEPGSYNWSLGVQRDVGLGFVLDVSYVGTVGRHMRRAKGINTLQYGTRFQPWAINPDTGRVRQDNELRKYQGYGAINYYRFDDSSNYHSMQTSLNRRFGTRLTIGGFWTWSKTMDFGEAGPGPAGGGSPDFMPDSLFYGRSSGDHTHNVMANFTYMVPGLSSRMGNNGFARQVFDGWQFSGIVSMVSGAPQGVNFTVVGGPPPDFTGSDAAPTRADLIGNPILSDPTGIQSKLNGDAIALPKYGDPNLGGTCVYGDPFTCGFGNAPRDVFRGPGTNNWDLSLFKNFQLGSNEARSLQFRWETYNTFNHTQYNSVDAMAMFNPAGVQINNTLGQYNNASAARKMVLALKLKF
jgi:hypothetical protein